MSLVEAPPGAERLTFSAMPDNILAACGALAREIETLKQTNDWKHLRPVHRRRASPAPDAIPGRVEAILEKTAHQYAHRFVAYADCGTGGGWMRF